MANPSGRIGSKYEEHVLEKYIKPIWPNAYRPRLKGKNDYGDYDKVGLWLIEAKKRKKAQGGAEFNGWINTILSKVRWRAHQQGDDELDHPWALICAGDKRTQPDIDLMVMDARWGAALIDKWENG